MKAIQTSYKGYRFRSRLEARWAVFFDALGIKWEYEPEGFELGFCERYLPDFFLPGFHRKEGIFVEVKPENDGFSKAKKFSELSGHSVLLAAGTPDSKLYWLYGTATSYFPDRDNDSFNESDVLMDVLFYAKYLPGGTHGDEYRFFTSPEGGSEIEGDNLHNWQECAAIDHAVSAARGARFEFGEQGN